MEPADFYHECLYGLKPEAPSHWAALAAAYEGRAYHNLNHLREMLSHYAALPSTIRPFPPDQTERYAALFGLALIYHDVIYVAGRRDNEARSADLLAQHLSPLGVSKEEIHWCKQLIMATKTHQPSVNDLGAEALLIDLDLAVLARPEAGYTAYTRGVRKEFGLFPNFLYKPGRRKALQHFLDQPVIYCSSYFRNKWETTARDNLTRELHELK